eukprot:scaffold9880_cov86-Cylindrotheca_fusiformis.AAC.2
MQGTKIGFATRVPMKDELENCIHIDMTSKHPWDQRKVHLQEVALGGEDEMDEMTRDLKELLISKVNVGYEMQEVQQDVARGIDVPSKRTFGIGPSRARATLGVTTQRGTRSAILPFARRYKADRYFNLKRLQGRFATDTFYAKMRSLLGNSMAQIYSHKSGFKAVYPMRNATGDLIGQSLKDFIMEYGAPEYLQDGVI